MKGFVTEMAEPHSWQMSASSLTAANYVSTGPMPALHQPVSHMIAVNEG